MFLVYMACCSLARAVPHMPWVKDCRVRAMRVHTIYTATVYWPLTKRYGAAYIYIKERERRTRFLDIYQQQVSEREREKEKGKKKCVKVTGHLLIPFWFSFSLYLSKYLWRKCLLREGEEELLDGSRSSKRKQKPNRSRHYCVRRSISFDGERECSTHTQSDRCRFWGQSAIKMLPRDLYTIHHYSKLHCCLAELSSNTHGYMRDFLQYIIRGVCS